ncbi:pseudouridine synthase [Chloroflexota bacterium]
MNDSTKKGERIAKIIARAGTCSRRDAERLIDEGRVTINNVTLKSPAVNVVPGDAVLVDNKPIATAKAARLWRYHKPSGLVVTHKDPQERPTVFDHLPKNMPRVVSVGRLDMDTEGLLLLTNDGELSRTLELPTTGWIRKYQVLVYGQPDQKKLDTIKNGIDIEGIRYGPIDARIERIQTKDAWLTFTLFEGKNREIRRVCQHLRLHITKLIRISYGPFELCDLAKGKIEEVPVRILAKYLNI